MLEIDIMIRTTLIDTLNSDWMISTEEEVKLDSPKLLTGIKEFDDLEEMRSDIISLCLFFKKWELKGANRTKLIQILN